MNPNQEQQAKELAAKMIAVGDGLDPQLFMTAMVWAAAGAVTGCFTPDEYDAAIEEFSAQLKSVTDAITRGKERALI